MTFTWRRTFPNTHHDFVASEKGVEVGRIRRNAGGPNNGTWAWSAFGVMRRADEMLPLNGEAATRDEAIEALASAWGRAKAWSARTGKPLA